MNASVYSLFVVASVPCQKVTVTSPFGRSASHFESSPPGATAADGADVDAGFGAGGAAVLGSVGEAGGLAHAAARRAIVAALDIPRRERRETFMELLLQSSCQG